MRESYKVIERLKTVKTNEINLKCFRTTPIYAQIINFYLKEKCIVV
jgi:hypothetical protein